MLCYPLSSFSLLASGSDDYNVHIWNVSRGRSAACMSTGHIGNIFSVKVREREGEGEGREGEREGR